MLNFFHHRVVSFDLTRSDKMDSIRSTSLKTWVIGRCQPQRQGSFARNAIFPFLLASFLMISSQNAFAQGVGISESTITPDGSAILELRSTLRGFLPPRLTTAERNAIASPATGLFVFNTSTGSLDYFNGSVWTTASVSFANPTAQIGLTAVNGAATTAMRSDAAPALDVSIAPTWTGAHTWSALGTFNLGLDASGAAVNINASSNFNTNINTGTSTGAVTIGNNASTGITLNPGTGGATVIGSAAGTGAIGIATGTGAQSLNLGTGGVGSKTINIGGTAANTIALGNTQTGGSIALGAAMTTGTITIGGTGAQTGTIGMGTGTGAQTVNLASGTGAKTINMGGTGANTIAIGNTQTGGSIALGAAMTTGTITIGGTGAQTGAITVGSSTAAQTLNLGVGAGAGTTNIGSSASTTVIGSRENEIGRPWVANGDGVRFGTGRITMNMPTAPTTGLNVATTATVAQILDAGIIGFATTAARVLTLPSAQGAAGLVQNLPGTPAVGDIFSFVVFNTGANNVTLAAGAGITIVNTSPVNARTRTVYCRVTGVTPGAETISVY